MWLEPKTDWVSTDKINFSDFNRIKNNIAYLKDKAYELYVPFSFTDMGEDKVSYSEFPYADEFNNLERNLDAFKDNLYPFWSGETKEWVENQYTPTYEDLNRIESACLYIYNGLKRQESATTRLSFTLGTSASDIRI